MLRSILYFDAVFSKFISSISQRPPSEMSPKRYGREGNFVAKWDHLTPKISPFLLRLKKFSLAMSLY
jgi:hypothetical protein